MQQNQSLLSYLLGKPLHRSRHVSPAINAFLYVRNPILVCCFIVRNSADNSIRSAATLQSHDEPSTTNLLYAIYYLAFRDRKLGIGRDDYFCICSIVSRTGTVCVSVSDLLLDVFALAMPPESFFRYGHSLFECCSEDLRGTSSNDQHRTMTFEHHKHHLLFFHQVALPALP